MSRAPESIAIRRAFTLVGPAIVLMAAFHGSSVAQVPDEPPDVRPWTVGRTVVYPLFRVSSERDDNVFSTTSSPVASDVHTVALGTITSTEFGESHVLFGYVARYRDYSKIDVDRTWSHFLSAAGDFRFARGAFADVKAEYQSGVLDTQVFDPGGETVFRGDSFASRSVSTEIGTARGDLRRIYVRAAVDQVRFDNPPDEVAPFFDVDSAEVSVNGSHRRGPRAWILWEAASGRDKLTRALVTEVDRRDAEIRRLWLGARVRFSPASSIEFRLGPQLDDYESTRFRGATGRAVFSSAVPARPRWTLLASRALYPSTFAGNDFYRSDLARFQVESPSQAALFLGFRASYFRNVYPEPDPVLGTRRDDLVEGSAWIGYRHRSRFEYRLDATWQERTSSIPGAPFERFRLGVSVGFAL